MTAAELADANLVEAVREHARWQTPCEVAAAPLAAARAPDGVRVERFGEARHVADAVEVNAQAYEMIKLPAAETRLYFSRPGALLSPRVAGFVAYRGGRPVATALAILGGAAAGVYWVGTAAGQGRDGLGSLCTALATDAAFEAGARAVTLQASPFGEALYRRLGYRDCDRMRRYRVAAPG